MKLIDGKEFRVSARLGATIFMAIESSIELAKDYNATVILTFNDKELTINASSDVEEKAREFFK